MKREKERKKRKVKLYYLNSIPDLKGGGVVKGGRIRRKNKMNFAIKIVRHGAKIVTKIIHVKIKKLKYNKL